MSGHNAYNDHYGTDIKGYLVSIGKRVGITTLQTDHVKKKGGSVLVALVWHDGHHVADILRMGYGSRKDYLIEPTTTGLDFGIDDLQATKSKSAALAAAKILKHLDNLDVITKRERQMVLKNIQEFVEKNEDQMDVQMVSAPYMSNEFYRLTFSTDVAEIVERGEVESSRKALWKMTRNELVTYLLLVLEAYADE